MRIRAFSMLSAATCLLLLQACSTTTESKTDSGDDSKDQTNSSDKPSTSAGGCSGDVTDCAMGALSAEQYENACSTILAAIDSPAGSKFECTDGPNEGLYLTVNSAAQCAASRPPSTCKVKVGQLIDCYKAAKKDACAAFDDECTALFDPNSGCVSQ